MRRVDGPDGSGGPDGPSGLRARLAEASAEAGAAFGNPALYLEKLIAPVRHVEVQVLADTHGTVVALGERECSLQRRHQKVIEESPSTAVHVDLREQMLDAARRAAAAAGYVGAGTVEFLLGPDDDFYFLEVNARIQVEHPITEERFGVDLVGWQLRVAGGEALDPALATAAPRGWAMEARLYAEDPATGFLPSAGRIVHLRLPSGPGIRVDGGVEIGTVVPVEYDPVLAKIIAWGPDREAARARLRNALAETEVLGLATNAAFLRRVLDHPAFVDGETYTHTLETTIVPELAAPSAAVREVAFAAAAIALEQGPAPVGGAGDGGDGGGSGGGSGRARERGPWELLGSRQFPESKGGAS
jgi:acetyl/propionyl-CoA carboxylase alpha subunit